MLATINDFVKTMVESQEKLNNVKVVIDEKNQALETYLEAFRKRTSNILSTAHTTEDEDLDKLYQSVCDMLSLLLGTAAREMESSGKGVKFIKDYEDSFNVAVFGKVKAGKSYLGNFVMGNPIRKLGIESEYDKLPRPTVEVYDRGKRSTQDELSEMPDESGNDGFFVDPSEATSAIQLFRLGGLTWFDTPGTGSLTKENEDLAKDYVKNADLVIFTCNSDAAGTRQDFGDMKQLYEMGKPFLLLLTQSDTLEEDTDEDGDIVNRLVAKSDADRRDTEAYMRKTLTENGLRDFDNGRILTISAKLGLNALETGSEELYADSHMDDFFNILSGITRTEAAELKLKTPKDRLNQTIKSLMEVLDAAAADMVSYQGELEKVRQSLVEKIGGTQNTIQIQCMNEIEALIHTKSRQITEKGGSVSAVDLEKEIDRKVYEIVSGVCRKEFAAGGDSVLTFRKEQLEVGKVGGLEMQTDRIHYTIREVRRRSRDPEGFFEHIGAFFGKEYYETVVDEIDKSHEIALGVNEAQILSASRAQLNTFFERKLPQVLQEVGEHCFSPLKDLHSQVISCIKDTKEELESMKC